MAGNGANRAFLGGWKGFGLGIAASILAEALAPELRKSAEPAARSALKLLFRAADQLARSTARTREQMEDFVASARAEYDAELAAGPSPDGQQPHPEGTRPPAAGADGAPSVGPAPSDAPKEG
jgi:hypothetical protein